MSEFWLVSAPAEPTVEETKKRATEKTKEVAAPSSFHVPYSQLKVGTLDALISLSDELHKADTYVESVCYKLSQYMTDLLSNSKEKVEKLAESLLADGRTLDDYVNKFQWDSAKYNLKLPIRELMQYISQQVSNIESEMKQKIQAYNKVKSNLQAIERKATGSLLVKGLNDVVKKDHFVLDSEYLVTLLVVVPRNATKDWETMYGKLTDYVVPRSSELITEDSEYALYSVTVFRKIVEDFRAKARENRFIVREYEYDEEAIRMGTEEANQLRAEITKKFSTLMNWCKVSFSEVFTAWIHIKALRVFVESVLRYGLPPNFASMSFNVPKSKSKRVRQILRQLYASLDKTGASSQDVIEIAGISSHEYFPYVSFTINCAQFTESR